MVVTIILPDEDLVRLAMIEMDRDAQEALAFLKERILPEVRRQQNSRMKGPFDGCVSFDVSLIH